MDVHHSGEAVIGKNEMEAAAGAENLRGVVFQRIAAGEGWNFVAHYVLRAKAGESFPDFNLGDAFLSGVQDEPADEGGPETTDEITLNCKDTGNGHGLAERPPCAGENHGVGDDFSACARHARRSREVFRNAPNDGAEDSSAVEWEPGQ